MIQAVLAEVSPLRAAFPRGTIPLVDPSPRRVSLGEVQPGSLKPADGYRQEECYILALKQCTPEQLAKLAVLLAERGQGSVDEALQWLCSEWELPVRKHNVVSVGMSLRAFI